MRRAKRVAIKYILVNQSPRAKREAKKTLVSASVKRMAKKEIMVLQLPLAKREAKKKKLSINSLELERPLIDQCLLFRVCFAIEKFRIDDRK